MYQEVTFGEKEKWSFKTGNLLKKFQFIWDFLWQDKKKWHFYTFDCLKEVTVWAGLTCNHENAVFDIELDGLMLEFILSEF